MQEQSPEQRKFELTGMSDQVQETQEHLKGLQDFFKKQFFSDPTRVGNLLFQNKMRKTVGSDGKIEEVPWTIDGVFEEIEKVRKEESTGIRKDLAVDTIIAIKSQERFFSATEHPLKKDSINNSAFILALLERVLSSKDEIGERYPIGEPTEEYWTAELLEVVRRIVLKPTTFLLEGYGKSGIHSVPGYKDEEFWEEREKLITDDMRNRRDTGKYHELEKERQKRAIENRGEDEWEKILGKESEYLKGYLGELIDRSLQSTIRTEHFAQRFIYNGKRVAGDEQLTEYQEKIKRAKARQVEYAKLKNFQKVLPWIKKNFGEDADFQTLLQFLNPIELTPQK